MEAVEDKHEEGHPFSMFSEAADKLKVRFQHAWGLSFPKEVLQDRTQEIRDRLEQEEGTPGDANYPDRTDVSDWISTRISDIRYALSQKRFREMCEQTLSSIQKILPDPVRKFRDNMAPRDVRFDSDHTKTEETE